MYYRVNIQRPNPETDENQRLCEYIEPLRIAEKIKVSAAYNFNLKQYQDGKECSLSPGFKYYFWFMERLIAEKFIEDWQDFAIKPLAVVKRKSDKTLALGMSVEYAKAWVKYAGKPEYDYYIDEEATVEHRRANGDWYTEVVEVDNAKG
jgi:hypothetical protein